MKPSRILDSTLPGFLIGPVSFTSFLNGRLITLDGSLTTSPEGLTSLGGQTPTVIIENLSVLGTNNPIVTEFSGDCDLGDD